MQQLHTQTHTHTHVEMSHQKMAHRLVQPRAGPSWLNVGGWLWAGVKLICRVCEPVWKSRCGVHHGGGGGGQNKLRRAGCQMLDASTEVALLAGGFTVCLESYQTEFVLSGWYSLVPGHDMCTALMISVWLVLSLVSLLRVNVCSLKSAWLIKKE